MKQNAILMLLLFVGLLVACEAERASLGDRGTNSANPDSGSNDNITVGDSDTLDDDTGFPTDDSTAEDSGGGPIEPTCTCNGVGSTLDAMVCAIDLCDPETVINTSYASPSNADTKGTYAAVTHFGHQTNDLAPLYGASYALMATGPAVGTEHSKNMGGKSIDDPFSKGNLKVNDVMEWTLRLKAPKDAKGFQIHYVFLSTEYDDWINTEYNDKFYVFLEAQSTNNGARTVINFTECRNPNKYSDFECDASQMACEDGQRYCYIAINTALSECCWYDGCPNGKATTDISGTGFECAANKASDGPGKGSSTGWLVTEWPVEPEEEFTVIFHIHDTSDHIYDSEVILDKFLFVSEAEAGTKPI